MSANWRRRLLKKGSGPTNKASTRSRPNAAKASSIWSLVSALRMYTPCPIERAAACTSLAMEMVDKFLTKMYRTDPDFVFTVTRDFVRNCQTPVLILPDDIPAHPYAVAMEAAM